MIKNIHNQQLREAFEEHLQETKGQIDRLEKAMSTLDHKFAGNKCDAMEGILHEGEEILEMDAEPHIRDVLIIAGAQKVEHYEISTYGTLCTWAEKLGFTEANNLLKENLAEEKNTDGKLTKLAGFINQQAS